MAFLPIAKKVPLPPFTIGGTPTTVANGIPKFPVKPLPLGGGGGGGGGTVGYPI